MNTWLKPQSVKDIQVFFDFVNFYKRFIYNFSKIAVSLTSILPTTDDNNSNNETSENKVNHNVPSYTTSNSNVSGSNDIDKDIENLSTNKKLAKFKKPIWLSPKSQI